MSGFEDRLRSALRDGTDEAPYAGSLASGARARLRRRRRRAGVVGAVAAVLAVAVPVGVVAGDVDGPQPVDGSGWHTETVGGVSVEVPGGWRAGEGCVAPDGDCEAAEQVSVVELPGGSTLRDEADPDWTMSWPDGEAPYGSELSLGFDDGEVVTVGDATVVATALDDVTTRRLLASARPEGDPAPNVAEWTTRTVGPLSAEVPVGPDVRVEVLPGAPDCADPLAPAERDGNRWVATYCVDSIATVSAPTQALADVVARSIRPADDTPPAEVAWRTVRGGGIAYEVPTTLDLAGLCWRGDCPVLVTRARDTSEGPAPGIIGPDGGTAYVGDRWVTVSGLDAETIRRILASARPSGTPAPPLAEWTTLTGQGPNGPITVDVPVGAGVRLEIGSALASCAVVGPTPARPTSGGEWQASSCGGGSITTITAPTQALADVVAQSLREEAPESGSEEWRTVTVDGVSVDLPPTVADEDVCWLERCPVGIVNSATIDVVEVPTPGLIDASGGTVFVGEYWVRASGLDFETTRRILASARPEGEPAPRLEEWSTEFGEGLFGRVAADVPRGASVSLRVVQGLVRCADTSGIGSAVRYQGSWQAGTCVDFVAYITAPTQALADVVVQTLRGAEASSTGDPWQTVEVEEALVELPGAWVRDPACAGPRAGRAPTFGPSEPDTDCADLPGAFAGTGVGEEPGPYEPGLQECLSTGWCGLTGAGDVGVLVRGVDRDTARRVAASLRGPDDPVVDVSTWVTRSVPSMASRGPSPLVSEVPVGGDVTAVKTIEGFCIDDPDNPIARRAGDAWDIGGCNTGPYVSAPTRAIAEVVFSTVR